MITLITCLIGGLGAGIGTGLAGLSAAAVISPMLITFLGMPAYQAVGIALASDVLASAVSAYTYGKNKNLDIKNGMIMMITVLIFTMVGSYISSLVPNKMMGNFSVYMTFLVGLKFIIKPVMTTKDDMEEKSVKTKIIQSILCGIIVGYIISLLLGMVSFVEVGEASWFQMPKFMHFGLSFNATAIISMVVMHIVNSVQAIGDLSATTNGAMNREATDEEISGGIVGNGISSILGSLFGCMPTATFSQNVGIVTMNKVINRGIFIFASIVIILSGLIPKFSSILISIPQCVLGGATITVFATITMTGIKMISASKLTTRNTTIVGLAIALGTGIVQVEGSLGLFPAWVISIFGKSSIVVTTLVAIILNLILPKEKEQEVKVEEKIKNVL